MRPWLVSGRLLGGSDRPSSGLRVEVREGGPGVRVLARGWSRLDGTFAIWVLDQGAEDGNGRELQIAVVDASGVDVVSAIGLARQPSAKGGLEIALPADRHTTGRDPSQWVLVSGTVTHLDGSPAPGLRVRAVGSSVPLGCAVTDALGRYSLGTVLPAGVGVAAQAAARLEVLDLGGRRLQHTRAVSLRGGVTPVRLDVELSKAASARLPRLDASLVALLCEREGLAPKVARALVAVGAIQAPGDLRAAGPGLLLRGLEAAARAGHFDGPVPSAQRLAAWAGRLARPAPLQKRITAQAHLDLQAKLGSFGAGQRPATADLHELERVDPQFRLLAAAETFEAHRARLAAAGIDLTRLSELGPVRLCPDRPIRPGVHLPAAAGITDFHLRVAAKLKASIHPAGPGVLLSPGPGASLTGVAAVVAAEIDLQGEDVLFSDDVAEAFLVAERLVNAEGARVSWVGAGQRAAAGPPLPPAESGRERFSRDRGSSETHAHGSDGFDGEPGKTGRYGNDGRAAPSVKVIVRELTALPDFDLCGEAGGPGGPGQQGEAGSDGERGGPSEGCYVYCCAGVGFGGDGGDGGPGGRGGPGGDGGAGGALTIYTLPEYAATLRLDSATVLRDGGPGGPGGTGGAGGAAGQGGLQGTSDGWLCFDKPERAGEDGGAGPGGDQGAPGRDGDPGLDPLLLTVSDDEWERAFTRPYIVDLVPNPARIGEEVVLTGANIPVGSRVLLDGAALPASAVAQPGDDELHFRLPPGSAIRRGVTVVSPAGPVSPAVTLTVRPAVQLDASVLSSLPSSDLSVPPSWLHSASTGRSAVTLVGTGFEGAGSRLWLGDALQLDAQGTSSGEQLRFVLPSFTAFEAAGIVGATTLSCRVENASTGACSERFDFDLRWDLKVPVIAHRVCADDDSSVITDWGEGSIRMRFEPGGGVNEIWGKHGIEFWLEDVQVTPFPRQVAEHFQDSETAETWAAQSTAIAGTVEAAPERLHAFFVKDLNDSGVDYADGWCMRFSLDEGTFGFVAIEDLGGTTAEGRTRVIAHELGHYILDIEYHRNDDGALMHAATWQVWDAGDDISLGEVQRARAVARFLHRDP